MVGLSISASELFSRSDVSLRVKFCTSVRDPCEDVGLTGMVDELKYIAAHASIDGLSRADFNNDDAFCAFRPTARLSH